MLRFLFTPRWLGLLVVVVVLGVTCLELSRWQFHRYYERAHSNDTVRANLAATPLPFDRVFSLGQEPSSSQEWRTVSIKGRYDPSHRVLVLYQIRNGQNGVDVVEPLLTSSGAAVLVDRGWIPSAANGNELPHVPAPPSGPVTVTGWTRIDSSSTSGEVTPSGGAVRAISSAVIKKTLPYPAYDGFVDLIKERPSVTPAPRPGSGPDLGSGPSFFYGIQWIFFAVLFFGFWVYFARAEYMETRKTESEAAPSPTPAEVQPFDNAQEPPFDNAQEPPVETTAHNRPPGG